MKIIIEVKDNGNTTITEESEGITYPICDITPNKFAISDITNIMRIKSISELLYMLGNAFMNQLTVQNIRKLASNNITDNVKDNK